MAVILAVSFASWACGGDAIPSSSLVVQVDTVNGVVQVSNYGAGPEWALVELVRVGTGGGVGLEERPDEFGQVVGVVANEDGTIYVADGMAKEIRVFSETGVFLQRIGREGGGPGEFRSIQSLGMLGDTIVVLDPGNGRLGFISPEGQWIGHRSYLRISGPDVRIFQTGVSEFSIPALEGDMRMVFVRHNSAGAQESISLQRPGAANFYVFCQHERGFVYFVPEWAPNLLRVPAPNGHLIEGWSGTYRLALLDVDGDTVQVLERDQPRLIPTDADWDDQVARFDSMMAPLSGLKCNPRRPVRPKEKGLIRAMFFDDHGRLWIERRTANGFALDAFDRVGALRGSVDIPNRVEDVPIFIRGDRVYLVVQDELGINTVLAFEVHTAATE